MPPTPLPLPVPVGPDPSNDVIEAALDQAARGTPVPEVCRRFGITELAIYRWRGRSVIETPEPQVRTSGS